MPAVLPDYVGLGLAAQSFNLDHTLTQACMSSIPGPLALYCMSQKSPQLIEDHVMQVLCSCDA